MSLKNVDIESALRRVADRQIEEARREGKFDNLPGKGQPLDLEPMPADENVRMTWPPEPIFMQDPQMIATAIRRRACELGFDLVGFASAEPSKYRDHFRRWLDEGRAGTMNYLAARFDERIDPAVYFPGTRSVICVGMNYHVPLTELPAEETNHHARIARYALGDDYHELMKPRLHQLADWIRQTIPEAQCRCAVDTAPVMERELAARAGIGWVGKNTLVISPQIGSWILLGEILTTVALPPDQPATDHCGTCRRCIDACPTDAITAPYELDARRCISYLTIEHRGEIAEEFKGSLSEWLYGCDICQDVCPWNHRAPTSAEARLQPRHPSGSVDLNEVLKWKSGEPNPALRKSAIKRIKLPVLQRNAETILKNRSGVLASASTPRDA